MDRGEPSLKPEWLVRGVATPTASAACLRPGTSPRAGDQDRGASSRNRSTGRDRERSSQQSASRRGSGPSVSRRHDRDGTVKSRGYASFGRSNRDRVCEKDSDFHDWESRLRLPDGPLRDGFGSFSSCRPESDRLSRVRPKLDTSTRTAGVSLENGNLSRKDAGGISFEREFPHLSSEDNDGKQDISRVPSPGISTPLQSIPLVTAPDGWNSVLAEVPGLSEPSNNYVSSGLSHAGSGRQPEVSSCGTALSMAETVMQAPLKVSTTPQLSVDAQKIEERTMRLRPLTPSSNKTSISSLSDKLKIKGARAGDSNGPVKTVPQLSTQPSNSPVRTPVKSEPVKPSQSGSFQVLTREQNGAANIARDCSSNPVSPVLGQSSSVEPLKRSNVNHKLKGVVNGPPLHLQQGSSGERKSIAKSKHIFFELLRSKSLNGSSAGIESSSSLIDEQKNPSVDLSLFNSGIKCIETGSSSCEDANSCDGSQRHFSDNEEIKPPSEPHDAFYEGLHEIVVDNKDANSSSDPVDAEDEAKASLSIIPTDTTDVSVRSDSRYDEALLSSEPIVARQEESYPTEDEPSPEEMAFLKSLGWKQDEVVPPLKQEEIADCLRHNVRLQQKLEECRG
ncbi:hypothetical protein CFC21_023939 [Triticum aestivum]|uniref:Uncharacterized protein n=3 Tax=Triticum TaxID=4564 RepID=A0A9R1RNX7_TRITD|nr:uncharacterized protein LOC123045597 [Triticum aestivum]KAF7009398.1 hypothetical protein CFC21_023939 [Triticum aestivum]VAH48273.1 unnamed protein product [Triticum turgidum subsp. durum]